MNLDRIAPGLDLALPPCLSNSAPEQADYSFEMIEYPGDSFTQLLGINNGGIIAGYHGVKPNKGFIYDVWTKIFIDENFPGRRRRGSPGSTIWAGCPALMLRRAGGRWASPPRRESTLW